MAAFGPKMLRLAGQIADRVALNMIAPRAVQALVDQVAEGAAAIGRKPPPVTVWAHVCLDPDDIAVDAAKRLLSGYVRAPGYDRNFVAQGFGELVEAARAAPSAREVRELITEELLVDALGFGTRADLLQRLAEYREVGVAIALVPNAASDPGAERTLAALATG